MSAPRDLTGQRFGRLPAIDVVRGASRRDGRRWRCVCSCGGERVVAVQELLRGDTQSCGCLRTETTRERGRLNLKHGHAKDDAETAEYRAWVEMRRRCANPNFIGFEYYGGRGIKVCARWRDGEGGKAGFECFLADMGPKPSPSHSLDRFPDVNGNYEPGNCRWATAKQQANNRRNSR